MWGARKPRVLRSSTAKLDDLCDTGGQHGRSGPNLPHGTSSGWRVILPWRLGAVHEFPGTFAARRNSGPGYEKAGDAGLGVLLWGSGNCLGSTRLGWAISMVSSVAPTSIASKH